MKVAVVNCFDTFLDRQSALLNCFQRRGDQVVAFLSDFRHIEKNYRTDVPNGFQLIHAYAYQKNLSPQRMYSHDQYAKAVVERLEREHWDLIWAIVPPNSLVKQCAQYKARHPETRLVFDVNDLWPESLPLGGLKRLPPFRMWQARRDHWLPAADGVVTECNLFREYLNLPEDHVCETIYYCKRADIPWNGTTLSLSDDIWSLCYLGSINHIIDIDSIGQIIRQMRKLRPVKLHIIGAGERKAVLIQIAEQSGAEVLDHGSIYDAEKKQAIFDQCHFGLNAMKSSVCVGLTMKSIDYLAGGLPLINTIPGDTWNHIEKEKFGLNWSPTQEPDWNAFPIAYGRAAARAFYERELTYDIFSQKVEHILSQLE